MSRSIDGLQFRPAGRGLAVLLLSVLVLGSAGPLGTWGVIEATVILPAVVASVGFLATPAFGILVSNWILGEAITPDLIFGTGLILAGVGLAAWPAARR